MAEEIDTIITRTLFGGANQLAKESVGPAIRAALEAAGYEIVRRDRTVEEVNDSVAFEHQIEREEHESRKRIFDREFPGYAARRRALKERFAGGDGQHYAVELDPGILAATITAIVAQSTRLEANRQGEGRAVQHMPAASFSAAMSEHGDLSWQIGLQGDMRLLVSFSADQFDDLDRQMEAVRELMKRSVQ